MKKKIVIIGAGGHAKVVIDVIKGDGEYEQGKTKKVQIIFENKLKKG